VTPVVQSNRIVTFDANLCDKIPTQNSLLYFLKTDSIPKSGWLKTPDMNLQYMAYILISLVLLLVQITPLADLSRVSLDLLAIHLIITLHSSIAATSASQYEKKTKIEQNAINSCHVLQFHVLRFHVRHFQRPHSSLSETTHSRVKISFATLHLCPHSFPSITRLSCPPLLPPRQTRKAKLCSFFRLLYNLQWLSPNISESGWFLQLSYTFLCVQYYVSKCMSTTVLILMSY